CEERISRPPAVGVEVLELDDLHSVPRGRADLSASPAGLTRGSIFLEELKVHSRKGMDCRGKPGNDADSALGTPLRAQAALTRRTKFCHGLHTTHNAAQVSAGS